MNINKNILDIFSFFKKFENSEKIYLVGGAVRDIVLGKDPKDLDFAIEGNAISFCKEFSNNKNIENFKILSEKFESCSFFYKRYSISFNSCRKDIYDKNGKLSIEKASIKEDLRRRDFTINAMALSLNLDLIDPLNGLSDLKDKKIKIINENSFIEDPSRIIRASRYLYKLNFSLEKRTREKIKESLHLLKLDNIRVKKEIERTLEEFSSNISEQVLFRKILKQLNLK